ncbi:transcriptional regulator [Chryseobacterium sp. CBo1]|uniref:helix-turn-helix domain-containing protein n=1 Tax=Chryseobacterium sp. CBo1 TaxID=1869230 RepID=UPI000810703C|nr:AraC family transcriptional regulator [Chryseobacterium sp. CBo1]OCK50278.1 transcriptional regulator [Chryseobacterium sp. CBo1]
MNIYNYSSDRQEPRRKVFLSQNIVSLLEQGEKVVYYAGNNTTISNDQFAILSAGNCLMTEKIPVSNSYQSTMLLFDNEDLGNFFMKYSSIIDKNISSENKPRQPFLVLKKDKFINNFIDSLKLIESKPIMFSNKIMSLKFEELMLHLLEKYPLEICSFHNNSIEEYFDFEIKKAVEMNISSNLTLEELAFLCNTSVSTFKRKFIKLYNEIPSKYFLKKKMEIAKSLLLKDKNPSEIYYKIGYENHSSFSKSFKQFYGISPKHFQQQKIE